ncbi:hypothetical protein CAAN1_02S01618 [[Candida] anglica]|uniref:Uncharacterized protein n=1 Tax=[Candida] anglica TaxID=148631 RepID=A0ABP0E6Z1_9ASCO
MVGTNVLHSTDTIRELHSIHYTHQYWVIAYSKQIRLSEYKMMPFTGSNNESGRERTSSVMYYFLNLIIYYIHVQQWKEPHSKIAFQCNNNTIFVIKHYF